MKAFVAYAAALLGAVSASPVYVKTIQQSGPLSGPTHAAFGDLVSTKRGLRPLSLEGFSEDDNQDGFVDNVAQAAVVAPLVSAPAVYHHPAPLFHAAPVVAHAAPVVAHAAPAAVYHAAPIVHKTVEVKAVEPAKVEVVATPAVTYTHHAIAAPALTYAHHAIAAPAVTYGHHAIAAPAFAHQVNPYFAGAPLLHAAPVVATEVKAVETEKVETA